MTHAEAKIHLNWNESEDELIDAYENQLFSHRQFFLTKTPIPTVFSGRFSKLKLMDESFEILGGVLKSEAAFEIDISFESEEIRAVISTYQLGRNQFKLAYSQANSGKALIKIAQQQLRFEGLYLSNWKSELTEENASLLLSKEMDPMVLLHAIQEAASSGVMTFSELQKNAKKVPEILVNEKNRLSLLYKKFEWNS
jgi:hypothetical protein